MHKCLEIGTVCCCNYVGQTNQINIQVWKDPRIAEVLVAKNKTAIVQRFQRTSSTFYVNFATRNCPLTIYNVGNEYSIFDMEVYKQQNNGCFSEMKSVKTTSP